MYAYFYVFILLLFSTLVVPNYVINIITVKHCICECCSMSIKIVFNHLY